MEAVRGSKHMEKIVAFPLDLELLCYFFEDR